MFGRRDMGRFTFVHCRRLGALAGCRTIRGSTSVPTEGPIDQWLDASGKSRHVKQVDVNAQPSLVKIGSSAVVRFDGVDDNLPRDEFGSDAEFVHASHRGCAPVEHRLVSRPGGDECSE